MALLVIGGVEIPVALDDGVSVGYEEIGDRARAVNGALLDSVRAEKATWTITTRVLTTVERDLIVATLRSGTPLVSATGDLVGGGPVSVRPVLRGNTPITLAAGRHWILQFDLLED